MISATRRRFFAFAGATPLAAKAAADRAIAEASGVFHLNGLGDASVGIAGGGPPATGDAMGGAFVPYEKRVTGAGEYLKVFGMPDWVEYQLRDNARYVNSLDHDLACKRSWSMSVKIAEQRQRNYRKAVERMHKSAWTYRGRTAIQKLLGFEWPW